MSLKKKPNAASNLQKRKDRLENVWQYRFDDIDD